MSIADILCFQFPVGWNELSAIATSVAVIVALVANRKSTQQLRSALKIQEQSKNVELLDRRMDMAEKIQSGHAVSKLTLQVLFNEEILKHYQAWEAHRTEKVYAENDMEIFISESSTLASEGNEESVSQRIKNYEYQMGMEDCPQQVYDEFEEFCNTHTIERYSGSEGLIVYNYSEISGRLAKAVKEAKAEQNATVQLMKEFISASIRSIDTEVKQENEKRKGEAK